MVRRRSVPPRSPHGPPVMVVWTRGKVAAAAAVVCHVRRRSPGRVVVKRLERSSGPTSYNDPITFSSGCLAAVILWPGLIQAFAGDGITVQLGGSRFFSLDLRVTEAARSAGGDAVVSWPPGQLIQAFGGRGALAHAQDLAGRARHPRCRVVGRFFSTVQILIEAFRVTRALLCRDPGLGTSTIDMESALTTWRLLWRQSPGQPTSFLISQTVVEGSGPLILLEAYLQASFVVICRLIC